jgi:phage terminase small subunit
MVLTHKQARFVEEYLVDLNATQAAIRCGYSPKTAYSQGQRLLKDVEVATAVAEGMAERSKRTEITADNVLRELWAIATADPNELIEYRRRCCRHCWGVLSRYQETQGERDARLRAWEKACQDADGDPDAKPIGDFDELGGIGFDKRRMPNPECPECFGEGVGEPMIKDTKQLSPEALSLYAGVKITRDGIEVKMHDKLGSLTQVGRHLGMFVDKSETKNEHSGPGGGPIETAVVDKPPNETREEWIARRNRELGRDVGSSARTSG